SSIVYASSRGHDSVPACTELSTCRSDIYVIDVVGGEPSLVSASRFFGQTMPTWSPDGTRIAFAEIGGRGTIVSVARDGSDRMELSPRGDVSFRTWSPD